MHKSVYFLLLSTRPTNKYILRKEDAIKLDLIHIAKLDPNGTRFFYQKKEFQMPQYVPHSLPGLSSTHYCTTYLRNVGCFVGVWASTSALARQ